MKYGNLRFIKQKVILLLILVSCFSLLSSCSNTSQTVTASLNKIGCSIEPLGNQSQKSYPIGPISSNGRWLVDKSGKAVILHGVNVVAKNYPYYPCAFGFSKSDVSWLHLNGLNLVRLGVLPSGEMPRKGIINQAYINNLMSTINLLSNSHIFVLLDWHQDDYGTYFNDPKTPYRADGMPSWMTVTDNKPNKQTNFPYDYITDPALKQAFQSFWNDDKVKNGVGLQQYYIQMLQAVVKKVADNPWVLGYEVMNEPWPGNNWSACITPKGCPNLDKTELDPFYAKAISAIRSIDRTHMIFIEPFSLFNFGVPTSISIPKGTKNIGLAFHQYAQSSLGANNVFNYAIKWSNQTHGALLNTEFSAISNNPSSITMQTQIADKYLMSWTYWIFDNCDIACSPAKGTALLLNPYKPPMGSNIDAPVVDTVVRPYPILISGTPSGISYNPLNGLFQFSWSSLKVGSSQNFKNGSITTVIVPKLDYPNGYLVTGSGIKVLSKPCSNQLVVAQTLVSSTLSLTLSPSSTC
jgi:endoglycosylceramidase